MALCTCHLLSSLLAASRFSAGAGLGFRHEPGVETRLLLTGSAEYRPSPTLIFGGLVTLAALENPGLARFGASFELEPLHPGLRLLGFELAALHEEWSDWRIGENRLLGLFDFRPVPGIGIGLGAAWRAPVLARFHSPFIWRSPVEELNLAYRLSWRFLSRPSARATLFLANCDRFSFHNPQQFPFGVEGELALGKTRLSARIGSAFNGFSSLLLSLAELNLHLGVSRDF